MKTAALLMVLGLVLAGCEQPALAEGRLTVVELFTSEGCSSCPPADQILAGIADKPGIIALAWHVTYWDRLGWQDPFGGEFATARQYGYRRQVTGQVATPQFVIDGRESFEGASNLRLAGAMADSAHASPQRPVVGLSWGEGGTVTASLPAMRGTDAELLLVTWRGHTRSHVTQGENKGRNLDHVHVVTGITDLGLWTGEARTLSARPDPALMADGGGVALLVQQPGFGPILAAAQLTR